jgi:sec-independent protein translocase protein TatA
VNILEPTHIMLILVVALIVFGPDKIPGIAKGLGKATREYKKAYSGIQNQFQDAIRFDDSPKPVIVTVKEETAPEVQVATDLKQKHSLTELGEEPQTNL